MERLEIERGEGWELGDCLPQDRSPWGIGHQQAIGWLGIVRRRSIWERDLVKGRDPQWWLRGVGGHTQGRKWLWEEGVQESFSSPASVPDFAPCHTPCHPTEAER